MKIQINKIKFASSGEITIIYDADNDGTTRKSVTLISADEPLPKFKESMQALIDDVIEFCKLDSDA